MKNTLPVKLWEAPSIKELKTMSIGRIWILLGPIYILAASAFLSALALFLSAL